MKSIQISHYDIIKTGDQNITDFHLTCQLMRQKDEELARELEQLKHRMSELEHLAKDRGLGSIFSFRHSKETDNKTRDAQSS